MNIHGLLTVAAVAGVALAAAVATAAEPALRVHLPRAVQVDSDALALGTVSVVGGASDALVRRAMEIPMGRAPWPREEIVIDRLTILGRLASHGIGPGQVAFSGADKIVVRRDEKVLAPDDVAKAAQACLDKNRPSPAGCRWRLPRPTQEMAVPAGGGVRLEARMVAHDVTGEAKVEVAAMAGDRLAAVQTVLFRMAYVHHEAVTTADIAPGGVLGPENLQVRTFLSDAAAAAEWTPPYGQAAVQALRAGTVVRPAHVRSPQAPTAVKRNENVLMRLQGAGFLITAVGQAMEDGRPGGLIRVRNIDSQRILMARVMPDGAVEPVFDEVKR